MKTVNLLGRGPSLQHLNKLPDSELVILAAAAKSVAVLLKI